MTLFLLSLIGIPPTAGFFAKFLLIKSAVEAGGWVGFLAVLMMLNAAAAAFYYLRVVVYMFMREPVADAATAPTHGRLLWSGLAVATVLTILFGVFPDIILGIVTEAATAIGT
jgi:NADH-quinone oxidoreductase subunit N